MADPDTSTLSAAVLPPPEPDGRHVAPHSVLKQGDMFLVANAHGDLRRAEDGLFHNDMRILSSLRLTLGGKPAWMLGSSVSQDNVFFSAHMTNRPLQPLGGGAQIQEGVIHLERKRFIWKNRLHEQLRFASFSAAATAVPLTLHFDADFRDMFEVRGHTRPQRGASFPACVENGRVIFRYHGLDHVERMAVLSFSIPPDTLDGSHAQWSLPLCARHPVTLFIETGVTVDDPPSCARFRAAAAQACRATRQIRQRSARPMTPHRLFNAWLDRSQADLALLTTELPTGPYPYAGIPWFSTPFGRDAVVTALQTLWLNPTLTRGVLAFLAAHQAQEFSAFADSAPGKIMHETRKGEMTALGELPFRQYYGGVDTTPLFVVLAGAYADRTGDQAFIDHLWPALRAAMAWVEGVCDSNPDGFLDYARGQKTGLLNQGWKDSADSIFHADGAFPEGPVALLEVQGYVYAALRAMARLAERRGDQDEAERWSARAQRLRDAVEDRFWMPDQAFYGVALDGQGALCRVRTSNAGHLLWSGLPSPERGAHVAEQLRGPSFNSGWGIRTLADTEPRFNPMSYHNGSVWPHDNALCAAGIARYAGQRSAMDALQQAFHVAISFHMRLPELFCGFRANSGATPIPYPLAALPQAWAAGSVFMLLQACLGLTVDGWTGRIIIDHPCLPMELDRLVIRRIPVGAHRVDLTFQRIGARIAVFAEGDGHQEGIVEIRG